MIGGAITEHTIKRLTADFSFPGQSGYNTEKKIFAAYGNGDEQAPLVVTFANTTFAAAMPAYRHLQDAMPAVRVVTSRNWVTGNGHTVYALVFVPPPVASVGFGDPYETRAEELLTTVACRRARRRALRATTPCRVAATRRARAFSSRR